MIILAGRLQIQMMEQQQRDDKYKIQTFSIGEQQYLYELEVNGEESIVKIYSNEGKLRSTQRIKLPANALVYPCEHYLIALTPTHIYLYPIASISIKATSSNPGVNRIKLIRYNKHINLIFFLTDSNELFYIMPEIANIQVKRIFSCSLNKIPDQIVKLQTDHNSIVMLLCQSNQTLYCLKFDWNNNDTLQSIQQKTHVVNVYYQQKWSVVIKVSEEDQDNYQVEINDENDDHNLAKFGGNVPKFQWEAPPIIKSTPSNLLYLDRKSKTVIIIHQKEQLYENKVGVDFPKMHGNMIFEIKKKGYNLINLVLHFFKGTSENFLRVEVPIKLLEMDEAESTFLYIHNNIHLILTSQGVERHFCEKVKQYLQMDREENVGDQRLTCMLLDKLFETSPATITKLANHFRKQSHHTYLPSFLYRYRDYLSILLLEIPFMSQLNGLPSSKMNQSSISKEEEGEWQTKKHRIAKTKLQSMISFSSMLLFAIKQEQLNMQKKQAQKKEMKEENTGDCSQYYQVVERCKVAYLLNDLYKNAKEKVISSIIRQKMEGNSQIPPPNQIREDKIKDEINLKIGVSACHQFFDQNLPKTITTEQINKYLAECGNFYHAAYFYLQEFKQQREVPYIGDEQTVELIKFLIDSPVSVLKYRQHLRMILKNLPRMAGKALVLNQPAFLQYLCSLSVNASEYKSCLAILISGVGREWSRKTHPFIIECLILCDRAALAYNQVQVLGRGDGKHKRQLMEHFTSRCIKEKRIKDLLQISRQWTQDEEYIRSELNKAFGDDVKEIIELMEKLNNSQA